MKALFAAVLLMSLGTWACPDLKGTYDCQQGSHRFVLAIDQQDGSYLLNQDGVQVQYKVDGKFYSIPETDSYKDARVASSCSGQKLVTQFDANIVDEGSVIAHQVSKTEYSKEAKNLVIVQKTKMKGLPMPSLKFKCSPTL